MSRPRRPDPPATLRRPADVRRTLARFLKPTLPTGAIIERVHVADHTHGRNKGSLRYRVALRPAGRPIKPRIVRANVVAADRVYEVVAASRAIQALRRSRFPSHQFIVPHGLGYSTDRRAFFYEEVVGQTLPAALEQGRAKPADAFYRAGAALRRLHDQRLLTGHRRVLDDVRREAQYFYDDFRQYAPALLASATPLLEQVVRLCESTWVQGRRAARLIHGDYKPDNLLLDGDRTAIIDFGNSVVADPTSDVGNFIAQTQDLGWRNSWSDRQITAALRAFRRGYAIHQLTPSERRRVATHTAWWHLQLLAFTVSTDVALARRLTGARHLRAIERILATMGLDAQPWERGPRDVDRFRRDARLLTAFFRSHLVDFFPGAVALTGIHTKYPSAFSHASAPTSLKIQLRMIDGALQMRHVRGNRVNDADVAIFQRLAERTDVPVPRVLWYNPRAQYVFYEELPGRLMRQLPFRTTTLSRPFAAIGAALAIVHRTSTVGIPPLTLASARAEMTQYWRRIQRVRPPRATSIERSAHTLSDWMGREWTGLPQVICHNDFQASNLLLLKSGRIGIIDFTRGGRGPIGLDAGQFLAHLTVMLAPHINATGRKRLRHTFLTSYRRGLSSTLRRGLETALPFMEMRAALDIIAITCDNVPAPLRDQILAPLFDSLPTLTHGHSTRSLRRR